MKKLKKLERQLEKMTLAEIQDCLEEDRFQGKRVNFEKLQVFTGMERTLAALKEAAPGISRVEVLPPASDHRHAILFADFGRVCMLDRRAKALLRELLEQADHVVVAGMTENARLTFGVLDIWEE